MIDNTEGNPLSTSVILSNVVLENVVFAEAWASSIVEKVTLNARSMESWRILLDTLLILETTSTWMDFLAKTMITSSNFSSMAYVNLARLVFNLKVMVMMP